LAPLAAAVATGFALVAAVFLDALPAAADETGASPPAAGAGPNCSCPEASGKPIKPKFAGLGEPLDEGDEIAALASVQYALTNVGDGASYVWKRANGRLSGIVHPTSSFRNGEGSVCRHLVVMLTTGFTTRKTEGTACRIEGGRWQLNG
jgi:surface antigen